MNNISLNGKEMIIGDSIIIFIVIRIDVMIKLMIKKGMNNIKLIWKVVFSLLVMNVGIRIVIGILLVLVYLFLFLVMCMKVFKFFIWVCESINVCMGFLVCLRVFRLVSFLLR